MELVYTVKPSEYIKKGFEIFKKDAGSFIAFSILAVILQMIPTFIFGFGNTSGLVSLTQNVFSLALIPLTVGYAIYADLIERGMPRSFGNFFDGYKKAIPLIIAYVILGILVVIGLILFVIPGIYLAVSYMFVALIVWFGNETGWEALEKSRKIISKKWWDYFLFALLLFVLNMAGLLALGIGIFITIPISYIAVYVAYREVFPADSSEMMTPEEHFITD